MATSSRHSALFGVQDWKKIYQTYREADFQSYDYETLRKSFIDYLTAYYPETFNDYIESSEFVALLDVMAYMGQALAFRNDLNTRENFIDTAERRDSVIKLANLIGYSPKRNIAGQGLLKVTAVSTTENVVDINGTNLSNTTILWNDSANQIWQEQFNAILNATFTNSQRIGRPGNSKVLNDIKTDEYAINIPQNQTSVVPFRAEIDGTQMSFELVSVTSLNKDSLYELPPAPNGQFNMLYRNDKLGYGSPNTGFFFYFKQGALQNVDFVFSESIENNFKFIDVQGINNSDTWLYELNSNGAISDIWTQVDNIYINSANESTANRKIFSVTSRFNDQVTYLFGDGVFGKIPIGSFRAYVRTGNALTYSISSSELQGIVLSIDYVSRVGRLETLTMTLSLQTSVNTAQSRETISTIKERAPARYYTQNRMVNGEDYTNFPFTLYNSIIKSKALNRSSIGVSRNLDLLDPTGKYSSTNVFADDGALYYEDSTSTYIFSTQSINFAIDFISQKLSTILRDSAVVQHYLKYYPRYSGSYNSTLNQTTSTKIFWNLSSYSSNSSTGYFKVNQEPVSIGTYGSQSLQYITKGSHLKFVAPIGYYFDSNNRLKSGYPNYANGDKLFIWVGVTSVIGDGKNFGSGNLNNGNGPVTLNSYVPNGVYLDTSIGEWNSETNQGSTAVIPVFDNTIDSATVQEMLNYIKLEQNFYLDYDNSQLFETDRWTISLQVPSRWILYFKYNSIDKNYQVTVKNVNYYFASVDQVRFTFNKYQRIFDSKTGKILNDFVNIIKTNNNSNYTNTLGRDFILNVTEQLVLSDGYPDDYQVKISSIDPNTGFTYDPDFFNIIIGSRFNNPESYVFFQLYTDADLLYRSRLMNSDEVIYSYATKTDIQNVMYEYPSGTIFYAKSEGKFYQSELILANIPDAFRLSDVSSSYYVRRGRNDINFQYRHNSDNSTRIDPATTNIIDLYVVTQSYYNDYRNWINDSTNTVTEPKKPTINELQQAYDNLDDYKMISDSVILNSVTFKPLFGSKASPELQGTIKVIKSTSTTVSDSQIRSNVLTALNKYFTIDKWNFGDTFYFSELTAYLHAELAGLISSVVLVPNDPKQTFGDLYEIRSAPYEIFVNGANASDIIVISALTPSALQRIS